MADCYGLAAILVALRSDIFGGIAGAYQQDVLALEFTGIAKIMGMKNTSVESLHSLELRDIRRGEMT